MNNLFSYITLIKNSPDSKLIVDRVFTEETVEDDWSITQYSEQIVTFQNGVVIKQTMENDLEASDTDMACEECFIDYEVLKEPETCSVMPKSKNFINQCQEEFWLKINSVQNL